MAPDRIEALDLIRGIAVLGILAINIAGFAGPPAATLSPNLPNPGTIADQVAFAVAFVLFEGKMRALFCLLFGASLVLFVERVDARGGYGDILQMKRLGWLALFGLAHFYLLWWGDILFLLAVSGAFALLVREAAIRPLLVGALGTYAIWHVSGIAFSLPDLISDENVRLGIASEAQTASHQVYLAAVQANIAEEIAAIGGSFAEQAMHRIGDKTLQPLTTAIATIGETLPLMLIGIALQRSGFFAGQWPRARVRLMAWTGTLIGLMLTLALLSWAWPRGFPVRAMESIFLYWGAFAHLPMALGYAAILVLVAPRLVEAGIGKQLVAAGRMAFSNYIGTTIVMTGIFYGWGLGLAGKFGHTALWTFVLSGWILMLVWSRLWLARFRRGPLEWAWRSLVEKQFLTNRR